MSALELLLHVVNVAPVAQLVIILLAAVSVFRVDLSFRLPLAHMRL